jgi:hypothetical protein
MRFEEMSGITLLEYQERDLLRQLESLKVTPVRLPVGKMHKFPFPADALSDIEMMLLDLDKVLLIYARLEDILGTEGRIIPSADTVLAALKNVAQSFLHIKRQILYTNEDDGTYAFLTVADKLEEFNYVLDNVIVDLKKEISSNTGLGRYKELFSKLLSVLLPVPAALDMLEGSIRKEYVR